MSVNGLVAPPLTVGSLATTRHSVPSTRRSGHDARADGVVAAPPGQRGQLEERRVLVDEELDPLAGGEPAAGVGAGDVLLPAAGDRLRVAAARASSRSWIVVSLIALLRSRAVRRPGRPGPRSTRRRSEQPGVAVVALDLAAHVAGTAVELHRRVRHVRRALDGRLLGQAGVGDDPRLVRGPGGEVLGDDVVDVGAGDSTRRCISTSRWRTTWRPVRGRPKVSRSRHQAAVRASARAAMP